MFFGKFIAATRFVNAAWTFESDESGVMFALRWMTVLRSTRVISGDTGSDWKCAKSPRWTIWPVFERTGTFASSLRLVRS